MATEPVNLSQKLELFAELWSPKVVAKMNDVEFKLAKIQGEFVWHQHHDTDEVFVVLRGSMQMEMRDRVVSLAAGELFVVPKGMEHKPVATDECHIMIVETAGVTNTGEVDSPLTSTYAEI